MIMPGGLSGSRGFANRFIFGRAGSAVPDRLPAAAEPPPQTAILRKAFENHGEGTYIIVADRQAAGAAGTGGSPVSVGFRQKQTTSAEGQREA